MIELGLKDSSCNYTRGYVMSFVLFTFNLIHLISGQTFEVTVVVAKILRSKHTGPMYKYNVDALAATATVD